MNENTCSEPISVPTLDIPKNECDISITKASNLSNNTENTINEASEKKKRRKSVKDSTVKIKILDLIDKGGKVNDLAIEYGVGASTIRDWMKSRDKIKELDNLNKSFNLSKKTLKNSDYPQVDKALLIWYKQQKAFNKPISPDLVSEKAKYFKQFLDLDKTKTVFSASHGFLTNFFQRHEYLTGEKKTCNKLDETLEEQLEQQNYSKEQIFILEETSLVWKTLPNDNYGLVSNEKIHIGTVFNCTGSFKLPMLIIDKSLRFDKNINLPIYYTQNPEIMFTKTLFKEWFNSEFVPKVEAYLKSINREPKALLLVELNHIREYLTSSNGSIKCMFRPINKSVESLNFNSCTKWLKNSYKCDLIREVLITSNQKNFLTNYSFKKFIQILAGLWLNVSVPMLKTFWKIYGFNLNEPEVSDSEINLNALLDMSKKLDFETNKIKAWFSSEIFDRCYGMISDEDIIKKVLNDQTITQIDENNRSIDYEDTVKVSDSQAILSVDTLINWLESQKNLDQSFLSKALEIRHLACKNLLSDIESKKCDSNEPNTLKQNTSIINKDNIQKDPNSIDLSKMSDTLKNSIIDELSEPVKKRSKIVLDNSIRIKILNLVDEGKKINDLAAEYGIGSTTIRDWLKAKDKILEKQSGKITNFSKSIPYNKNKLKKKSKRINKISNVFTINCC